MIHRLSHLTSSFLQHLLPVASDDILSHLKSFLSSPSFPFLFRLSFRGSASTFPIHHALHTDLPPRSTALGSPYRLSPRSTVSSFLAPSFFLPPHPVAASLQVPGRTPDLDRPLHIPNQARNRHGP
ncbi:hypothetical protein L207DRAFT_516990 [Hyaloscypha variabilis F]|uniref:Uncharacterized protein n=1 Tax=Hyaloscypha variabilis (strain UAMH 11265 / GT02V1 / F) TaxID=1149755 RepID=A0A2J6R8J6_HYAVF|nr:hypothetical protein L207DRAFT_516990 [Hyaloscypha variabilis F]